MAAIIERTAAQDITDALDALDELARFARDTRAHLENALAQAEVSPGTLDAARHAAKITTACAANTETAIRAARFRMHLHY